MHRLSLALLLLLLLCAPVAAARGPAVVISYEEPPLESLARRLRAEMLSAGRKDVVLERRSPLGPCPSRPPQDLAEGQVGVLMRHEGGGIVSAEICTSPEPNRTVVVTARGRLADEGSFAVVVTEALHGVLAEPVESARTTPGGSPAKRKPEPTQLEVADAWVTSLGVQSRIVLDLPTGDAWIGVAPSFQVPLSSQGALQGELFLGVQPIEYSDDTIELESHLAWARFGFASAKEWRRLRLAWAVSGGLFSNRATARALPPRNGGSDGTFGAIFGLGASGEFPARGLLFLRGSASASTLVPRLRYQMSEEVTPQLGVVLFETGLGIGLRFE